MPETGEGLKKMMQQANSLLGEVDLAELKDAVGIDDADFSEMIDSSRQLKDELKGGESGKDIGKPGENIKPDEKEGGGKGSIDEAELQKLKSISDKFNELMEKTGALDESELFDILDKRSEIMKKFGDRDPDEIFDAADKFKEMDKRWRDEQARSELELDDDDAPLEGEEKFRNKIRELETLNKELRDRLESRETNFSDKEKARQLLDGYTKRAEKIIELNNFQGDEAKLARIVLNLDNPIPDTDLRDNTALTSAAKGVVGNVKSIIKNIKQQAINDYAAGKSNFEPGGNADIKVKGKHIKEETQDGLKLKEGATVEESFGQMSNLLLEIAKNT